MTTFGDLSLGDHFQIGSRVYVKTDDDRCKDVVTRRTVRGIGEYEPVERAVEDHGWHISAYYLHVIFEEKDNA
jgi:hypothetical protein